VKYRPRQDDDEVAFLVGGQWIKVESDVQYLGDEHRFITWRDGKPVEIHIVDAHIQAVMWNVDQ